MDKMRLRKNTGYGVDWTLRYGKIRGFLTLRNMGRSTGFWPREKTGLNPSATHTVCVSRWVSLCDERKFGRHIEALCTTVSVSSVKIYASPVKMCQFIEISQCLISRSCKESEYSMKTMIFRASNPVLMSSKRVSWFCRNSSFWNTK